MKFMLILCVLSLSAVTLGEEKPGYFRSIEHPGKCVYDGKVLFPGEKYQPIGKCKSFTCSSALGHGVVYECDPQQVIFPCTTGDSVRPYASYPDCCELEIYCPRKRMIVLKEKEEIKNVF